MAEDNRFQISSQKPFVIEFVDETFVKSTVLTIDADPADPTGATPRLTIGAAGATTNVLGTLQNDGSAVGGGAEGSLLQPGSIQFGEPSDIGVSFDAIAAVVETADIPNFAFTGGTGADAGFIGVEAGETFEVDVVPIVFVTTLNAGGTEPDLATTDPLPACTAEGAGEGKTLTGDVMGVLTVDGVIVTENMFVLVKDEVDPVNNGLYRCTTEGAVDAFFVLTRAENFDTLFTFGDLFDVVQGDVNAGTHWEVDGEMVFNPPIFDNVTGELDGIFLVVARTGLGEGDDGARRRGLYIITEQGTPGPVGGGGVPWEAQRHPDFDSSEEVSLGALISVASGGASHGRTNWIYPTGAYTLGTSIVTIFETNKIEAEYLTVAATQTGPGKGLVLMAGPPENRTEIRMSNTNGPPSNSIHMTSVARIILQAHGPCFWGTESNINLEASGGALKLRAGLSASGAEPNIVAIQANPLDKISEYRDDGGGAVQMAFIPEVEDDADAIAFCEALRLYLIARGTMASS